MCTGDGDASMTIGWFAADAPETALTAVLGDFDNKAGTFTIYYLSVFCQNDDRLSTCFYDKDHVKQLFQFICSSSSFS